MRKRVIFDVTAEQYALIESRAAEAGVRPSVYVRTAALEAARNEPANEAAILTRLGFSSADQKAAHNKACRAGMSLKSYVRMAVLKYLPQTVSVEAASRWRQRLVCTESERRELIERAEMVGLSVGTYLVRVGLGYQPYSIYDHKAVVKLLQTAGALGSIGGLLKLWLTERPGDGVPSEDMRRVLNHLLEVQHELRMEARSLRHKS